MSRFSSRSLAILAGFFVFIIDAASKMLTHLYLPLMAHESFWYPYKGIGVFRNFFGIEFSISHATNRGAAWGVLAEYQFYLLLFRLVLVVGLIIYFLFYNTRQSWFFPLAFIIAGAAGNILDAFIYGHVVDMLHFVLWGYDFPVFNVADSSIFLGVSWLVLDSWLNEKKQKKVKKKARVK